MHPIYHIAASVAGGACLGGITHSWTAAGWSLVSGVFLDLDHVWEYLQVHRQRKSISDFFDFWRNFREPKLYVFFHAAEVIPLLLLAAGLGIAPTITGGLAFGLAHHIIIDQLGNGVRPGGYLLTLRWIWKFKSQRIFIVW